MPYKNKEDARANSRRYREEHREERRKYARTYYLANREELIEKDRERYKGKRRKQADREYSLRLDVLDALGGRRCTRCGFDDIRALQIDHVNGGGVHHRSSFPYTIAYYRYVLEHLNEFQVLCANCNWIKRYENGEVPTKVYSSQVKQMYG